MRAKCCENEPTQPQKTYDTCSCLITGETSEIDNRYGRKFQAYDNHPNYLGNYGILGVYKFLDLSKNVAAAKVSNY